MRTLALTPDEGTVLTILLVVVTINAVNFIDGLDGLATGIVGIGAAAFYLYYYTLAKRLGLSELADTALASAVLAGVCLGFLPHNFYPRPDFHGRHRIDAARNAAGLRADFQPGLARPEHADQPVRLQRGDGQPVPGRSCPCWCPPPSC